MNLPDFFNTTDIYTEQAKDSLVAWIMAHPVITFVIIVSFFILIAGAKKNGEE